MNTISLRASLPILALAFLISCAGSHQNSPGENIDHSTRIDNLTKAVQLPWRDDGSCVVRETSNEWNVVVERCFHALDLQKVRFEDSTGKCAAYSADVTALGKCLLAAVPAVETSVALARIAGPKMAALPPMAAAAPSLAPAAPFLAPAAGPVLIATGVVVVGLVVGYLIVEAIEDYQNNKAMRRAAPEQAKPEPIAGTSSKPNPKPQPSPQDRPRPDPIPLPYDTDPQTDKSKEKPGRIYATYTKLNFKTKRYYAGRTSMVIDLNKPHRPQALKAVVLRDRNHHIEDENPEPKGPVFSQADLDKFDVGTAVNYDDRYRDAAYWRIRGREQQLIDSLGGAWSDTPKGEPLKTENAKRGVAKDHENSWEFYKAATDKWGKISEYTGD